MAGCRSICDIKSCFRYFLFPNLSTYRRSFSTSSVCNGKRNFRKFTLINRGTANFKKKQLENPDPDLPHPTKSLGIRDVGYKKGKKFVVIPEMIPEIIVPDLTDFELKAYVSYRTYGVEKDEFTSRDLFDAVYGKKIVSDYKEGKLDADGNPLEPSENEKLTAEVALARSLQTGADLFESEQKHKRENPYLEYGTAPWMNV